MESAVNCPFLEGANDSYFREYSGVGVKKTTPPELRGGFSILGPVRKTWQGLVCWRHIVLEGYFSLRVAMHGLTYSSTRNNSHHQLGGWS